MAVVDGREGRERRSTASQEKVDPQHTQSSASLRSGTRSRTWAGGRRSAGGHARQLCPTFFRIPVMFAGVVGSGCRMHTKVVLHKQTSLRYRIQRWFRRRRGSAARSKQNLQQNRRDAPEDVCFHINDNRTSPLLVVSGFFVQNQSARTTADFQNHTWLQNLSPPTAAIRFGD